MILPPFQKQGHGAQLLQTFYNTCYSRSEVKDITGTFILFKSMSSCKMVFLPSNTVQFLAMMKNC